MVEVYFCNDCETVFHDVEVKANDAGDWTCPNCESDDIIEKFETECKFCGEDVLLDDENDEEICEECQCGIDTIDTDEHMDLLMAICEEFGVHPKDVSYSYSNNWEIDGTDYEILDEEEAEERLQELLEDELWTFNSSFLARETGISVVVFETLSNLYENSNEAIRSIIDATCGYEDFIHDAVLEDGLSHFLQDRATEIYVNGEYYYAF